MRETDAGHVGSKQNMTLIDLRGHPFSLKAAEVLKAVEIRKKVWGEKKRKEKREIYKTAKLQQWFLESTREMHFMISCKFFVPSLTLML